MSLKQVDNDTWVFEVEGSHLDKCQTAKSKVYDENEDLNYRDLQARVFDPGRFSSSLIVVVNTGGN